MNRQTAIDYLVSWANEQDHWLRGMVANVIVNRRPLTPEETNASYEAFLREKELADGERPYSEKLGIQSSQSQDDESLVLTEISQVKNVNALTPDQTIRLNRTLTVLYGENGAGKTGYVRILKAAAAVRNAKPVLSNVLLPTRAEPSAKISYKLGEQEVQEIQWSGETDIPPLNRVDIFDARGILIHVDDDLTYSYSPGELSTFGLVSEGITSIKESLDNSIAEKRSIKNVFTRSFSRESDIYSKIEALGPATDLNDLRALGRSEDLDPDEVPRLLEQVKALETQASESKLQLLRQEWTAFNQVKKYLEVFTRFQFADYQDALSRRQKELRLHEVVAREQFESESIPGALTPVWDQMLKALEAFIVEHSHQDYPLENDLCPVCQQTLAGEPQKLVAKYRAYCNDQHMISASRAEKRSQELSESLRSLQINDTKSTLATVSSAYRDDVPSALNGAIIFVEHLVSTQTSLQRSPPDLSEEDIQFLSTDQRELGAALDKHLAQLEEVGKNLKLVSGEQTRKLRETKVQLVNLQARLTLSQLLPEIETFVQAAKWATRASTIQKSFQSVLRSLTNCSKNASEQLLNQDFESHFSRECEALAAPRVSLEFPGRQGRPARRKVISPKHRLSQILSEGEQKVVALADFLAEALLRSVASPVILDDPVTSLDYRRLRQVVDRIVKLCEERQVIVFTHNLWFAMELLGRFEKRKAACA